jgi:hypothetical protein
MLCSWKAVWKPSERQADANAIKRHLIIVTVKETEKGWDVGLKSARTNAET